VRQSKLVLETLKRYLGHTGVTYRELARRLGQSEANIKRIFSQYSISLEALEAICEAVGIELLDLTRMSRPLEERAECFTRVQEEALAADPKLFAFLYLLLSDMPVARIRARYEYSEKDCRKSLLKLDKLGVIRLYEGDRAQVLVSRNIRWITNGPLNRLYEKEISQEFTDSHFSGANERRRFLNARLSKHSLQALSRRLDRLIAEFVELAEIDKVSAAEDSVPIWLIVAYRPWKFTLIDRYRRAR
jgi:transcriptional regulator with XRE-family HTH domain